MSSNVVVARFANGRTIKGMSLDVSPSRPTCHVNTPDGEMVLIALADLKALFFVKTPDGDPNHVDAGDVPATDPRLIGSRLVEIGFRDGEKLLGIATIWPPTTPFFFILPVDPSGNNLRVLVNQQHIESMTIIVPTARA